MIKADYDGTKSFVVDYLVPGMRKMLQKELSRIDGFEARVEALEKELSEMREARTKEKGDVGEWFVKRMMEEGKP